MCDIPVPYKEAVTPKRLISNRKSVEREFPVGLCGGIFLYL